MVGKKCSLMNAALAKCRSWPERGFSRAQRRKRTTLLLREPAVRMVLVAKAEQKTESSG